MQKYSSDNAYLFDLNVRVKDNPNPGQYQYMVKLEHSFYITNVLLRSYYRHEAVMAENCEEVCITTNCEPDAFKMIFERALMDKYRDDTGLFALTPNELKHDALTDAILDAAGRNAYTEYTPD